jgi:hypothetical protein
MLQHLAHRVCNQKIITTAAFGNGLSPFLCVQMSSACRRYQSDMAELSDQVRLLYREYSNSTASWQQKCTSAEKQVRTRVASCATSDFGGHVVQGACHKCSRVSAGTGRHPRPIMPVAVSLHISLRKTSLLDGPSTDVHMQVPPQHAKVCVVIH